METELLLFGRGKAGGAALDPTLGTIATIQGPFAYGPRPGQSNNIMDCPEYDTIPDADERARWRAAMRARGYKRWPMGPIFGRSYAGHYPDTDWTLDPAGFLARMDEVIAEGFAVNFHAIPDDAFNGDVVDYDWLNRVFKPIYQSNAYRSRFREVTIAWEPIWFSETWVKAAKWTRECFPDAFIWAHAQPGHSAPGDGTEDEGACHMAISPWTNGFRFQSGQMGARDFVEFEPGKFSRRTRFQQFLRESWDLLRRVQPNGSFPEWPKVGHGGTPYRIEIAEYASAWVYWGTVTEAEAVAWGRALQEHPAYEDPDRHDEIIDLAPYRPILCGDGGVRWKA